MKQEDPVGTAASEPSPFPSALDKYWRRRYEYFSRFDEGIQTDAEGLYSVVPEDTALAQADYVHGATVLDAFAGIGGNAIGFARRGKRVVAVDTNAQRLAMAEHNAKIYGVADLIEFKLGDCFELFDATVADAVYLDPPWGGPNYKDRDGFRLSDFDPSGDVLLRATLPQFAQVLLRVPDNFCEMDLDSLGLPYEIFDDFSLGRLVSKTVCFRGDTLR